MQHLGSNSKADIGDFAKMFAVTAVMIQSVISFLLSTRPAVGQQFFLGGLYEAVKFSAPAFIFGILFSTIRTHPQATWRTYPRFILNRWHLLFIPSIWWTSIYLLLLPQLQQGHHYHNLREFCWQFLVGNAAPHLWYNVMMLQFIILMPFFWLLANWVGTNHRRAITVFTITLVFEICWHLLYKSQVFHGPQRLHWYLIDRFFVSFLAFAVAGTLLWQLHRPLTTFLKRHWFSQIIIWLGLFYFVTLNFFDYGTPVRLTNAPYYLPSMLFYNFSTIGLIVTLACYLQLHRNQWLPFVHWVALYAHRAYLSHVFWLYLIWKLTAPFNISLIVRLPLLIITTLFLAFASAVSFHLAWTKIKDILNIRHPVNG